jgi:hypothetical protein
MKHLSEDGEHMLISGPVEGRPDHAGVSSRRTFLKSSGLAAVGVTVIQTAGLVAAAPMEAYKHSFSNLSKSVGMTLMRMARDIFPHDMVPDKYYAGVIASYDKATEVNVQNLVNTGVINLNAAAVKRFGKPYAKIESEGDRVVVLYAIEQSPFFQKIRGDLLFGLYNNKEVWSFFGFEGSSWEKGGYIRRGFNDIDWL